MDSSINFYELKEELLSLGFTDLVITDRVREMIYQEKAVADIYLKEIPHGKEKVALELFFDREKNGRLAFVLYSATMTVNGNAQHLRFQNFHNDVPLSQAFQLLTEKTKYPEKDEITCFTPLKELEVKEQLAAYAMPVPVDEKIAPILAQLTATGFNEKAIIADLRQKTEERRIRFYLQMLTKGKDADFLYTLNFVPNDEGQVVFDYYNSRIVPHDEQTQQEISKDIDHFNLSENFETEVSKDLATRLLETRLPLKRGEPHYESTPMTHEKVMAFLNQKQNKMNTQNLEFLKKSLLNLGFGDKLNEEMEKHISKKTPEFTLAAKHEFNQQKVDYTLHFKAGESEGMYFFNKYEASIQKGKDKKTEQTFYINKGNGITAKEAFNLMEGRAVHKQLYNKEGEPYKAWLQLDNDNLTQNGSKEIKRFNENYGFDLEQVISGKGIKEMATDDGKENLLRSLRKGNPQQITVSRNGEDTKYFIAASPQYKTVDLYDHQMKKIKREELLQPEQKQTNSQKQDKQQKEGLPEKKQQSKRKMAV